jgi:hypothetical protein
MVAKDKHSSLLRQLVNYRCKRFNEIGTRFETVKLKPGSSTVVLYGFLNGSAGMKQPELNGIKRFCFVADEEAE